MLKKISITLSVLLSAAIAQTPAGCPGVRNNFPILDIPATPLKTVTNGQSWKMEQGTNILYIGKVSGSAYQMGYALGELFGQEIAQNLQNMVDYGYTMWYDLVQPYLVGYDWLIRFSYDWAIIPLAYTALDLNWNVASGFIPKRFEDEMQGVAAGSKGKVDYLKFRRINFIPELTRAACTILGVHGAATADNKLYHLRTLDWWADCKVNQYPAVIIYEPTEPGSKTFANIAYLGIVGSVTAMSKIGITVGEKVMYYKEGTNYPLGAPTYSYFGKPWMFVLRDTIQFSNNIYDVERMLKETPRTVMIHLGYGSLPDNTFRGVDYAYNYLITYDDSNYTHYDTNNHPQLNGVFFYDKRVQPSSETCVANILKNNHGSITPETLFRDVAGYHKTGDAQVCVMDPTNKQIWVSYSEYNANNFAYQRSPIRVQLDNFW